MSHRLTTELALLYHCEHTHNLPAASVVRQLIAWEHQPLPDVLPPPPPWLTFHWPRSGTVDYEMEWRERDRQGRT